MKAFVFHGNEDLRFEEVPKPVALDQRDALVRVTTATICSTDVHIKHHGKEMMLVPGTILGHEFVGVVEQGGKQVGNFAAGDRVAVSCIYSCGECYFCRNGLTSQCGKGACFGGMGDGTNHGAHAEFIRVPFASRTMHKIPDSLSDEDVLFAGDILSTGYFGAQRGEIKNGDTVVVVGAGPVGMCAMIAARMLGAAKIIAINRNPHRESVVLENKLADNNVNPLKEKPHKVIKELTGGLGADVVIDAVGDGTIATAFDCVRPGGTISLIGVYNQAVNLPMYKYWWKNYTVRMGLVETGNIDRLIELIAAGRINTRFLITHTLPLDEIAKGYEIAENRSYNALKVAIKVS